MRRSVSLLSHLTRAWPLVVLVLVIIARVLLATNRIEDATDVSLPTGNDGLYREEDSLFYMETANSRDEPWSAGKFGFVRNPRKTRSGQVYLRHHAGIDIRPLYRDSRGEPLDTVRSVADGVVVYVNDTVGHSNYGRCVVVEHRWGGSPYYSLYAHLSAIWSDSGAVVRRGDPIARIGYTGAGINRRRAHLHLELALLVNEHFQDWYDSNYNSRRQPNRHGIFNGLNLVSIDVSRFLLRKKANPGITIPELVAEEEAFFTVTIPRSKTIDMLRRYPWLLESPPGPDDNSWRITFARHALPVRIEAVPDEVKEPAVEVLETSSNPYRWLTRSLVSGMGEDASLTAQGIRWVELMLVGG